jgi:hypothetical protein
MPASAEHTGFDARKDLVALLEAFFFGRGRFERRSTFQGRIGSCSQSKALAWLANTSPACTESKMNRSGGGCFISVLVGIVATIELQSQHTPVAMLRSRRQCRAALKCYDHWIKFEDDVENTWGPVHDLRAARQPSSGAQPEFEGRDFRSALLVPQGDHGVHVGRAPGGEP